MVASTATCAASFGILHCQNVTDRHVALGHGLKSGKVTVGAVTRLFVMMLMLMMMMMMLLAMMAMMMTMVVMPMSVSVTVVDLWASLDSMSSKVYAQCCDDFQDEDDKGGIDDDGDLDNLVLAQSCLKAM